MEATLSAETVSRQKLVLLVAILGWMFDGFEMGLFPLVARSSLIDLLGSVNDAAVGLWIGRVTALFLVGAALGGIGFGWLGDKIGRTKALALSILTYSCFTGLCYFVTSPLQLGLCRFLAALGMGGEWALGVSLVMETWANERRVLLAALIGSASHVGFVLVGILGLMIPVTPTSWRWLMALGVLPGLLTFLIRLYVPESDRWKNCKRVKAPIAVVFSRKHIFVTIVAILLATVVHIGTWGVVYWAPIWVDQLTGGTMPTSKALTQISCAVGAAIGGFSGAYLGTILGRRGGYAMSCGLALVCCLTLFLGMNQFGQVFLVIMFFVGFSTGTFYGWLALYLPELFPTAIRATGQGVAFNAGRLVAVFGVLFTGHVVHMLDGAYKTAGALTSLIYGVGFCLIWLAPKRESSALPE